MDDWRTDGHMEKREYQSISADLVWITVLSQNSREILAVSTRAILKQK